jgi:nucleotide-binding universal stress UspA family protein
MSESNGSEQVGRNQRVLVAIDGSEGAERALDWACRYASVAGCDVEALHVWGYPEPGRRTGISEPYEDMQLEAAELLRDQVTHYVDGHHPPVAVHSQLEEGPVVDVLVDRSHQADLLVVGRRGRGALRMAPLGSVSRSVAERAACPVVVVHPHDHVEGPITA